MQVELTGCRTGNGEKPSNSLSWLCLAADYFFSISCQLSISCKYLVIGLEDQLVTILITTQHDICRVTGLEIERN